LEHAGSGVSAVRYTWDEIGMTVYTGQLPLGR
jgi:hypothetical protein